jgi:hypothetical protein
MTVYTSTDIPDDLSIPEFLRREIPADFKPAPVRRRKNHDNDDERGSK